MRSLISVLLLVLALSACDNELKLISRDFSVSLKSKDSVHHTVQKITVMRYRNHNTVIMIQIIFKNGQCRDIKIVGWFVKNQYIGSFHKDPQQIQSALFSAGQFFDLSILFFRWKQKLIEHCGCRNQSIFCAYIFCCIFDIINHAKLWVHICNSRILILFDLLCVICLLYTSPSPRDA